MAHAEMTTLNAFEKKFTQLDHNDCSLITTVEPCMMCYSRLLISKISHIYYLADDKRHGAVEFSKQFPKSYDIFKVSKTFEKYDCSDTLAEIASDLFFKNSQWNTAAYQEHH